MYTATVFANARAFVYRNARPLDLARWQRHFEGGSAEAVLHALAYYQNADGGFGHALEADSWNPHSTPIQTGAAVELFQELGWTDPTHPVAQGLLRYLASGADFDGRTWANTVPTNNDYPHAPWWRSDSESACHTDDNPTAMLAGFALRFAAPDSALGRLAERLARAAADTLLSGPPLNDMHTTGCYLTLYAYCAQAGTDCVDLAALRDRLRAQVRGSVTQDTALWEDGYVCRPSMYLNTPDSPFYPDCAELALYECDFLRRTQQPDGSWPIPWRWTDYPEQWAVSRQWWKGKTAVDNTLYLRNFDRL